MVGKYVNNVIPEHKRYPIDKNCKYILYTKDDIGYIDYFKDGRDYYLCYPDYDSFYIFIMDTDFFDKHLEDVDLVLKTSLGKHHHIKYFNRILTKKNCIIEDMYIADERYRIVREMVYEDRTYLILNNII